LPTALRLPAVTYFLFFASIKIETDPKLIYAAVDDIIAIALPIICSLDKLFNLPSI